MQVDTVLIETVLTEGPEGPSYMDVRAVLIVLTV